MLIQYTVTKHKRIVSSDIGRRLIECKVAREVEDDEDDEDDVTPQRPLKNNRLKPLRKLRTTNVRGADEEEGDNFRDLTGNTPAISERTGKPKRKYKRRDMAAE